MALAEALRVNTTLTTLNLEYHNCYWPPGGERAIAEAMEVNFTVTSLEFCCQSPWVVRLWAAPCQQTMADISLVLGG